MDQVTFGQKVGKVIDQYKMGKHFDLQISDGHFNYTRKKESIL